MNKILIKGHFSPSNYFRLKTIVLKQLQTGFILFWLISRSMFKRKTYRGSGSCCMFFHEIFVFLQPYYTWLKVKWLRCPAFNKFHTKQISLRKKKLLAQFFGLKSAYQLQKFYFCDSHFKANYENFHIPYVKRISNCESKKKHSR